MTRYNARVTWANLDAPAFLGVFAADAKAARLAVVNALLNGDYPAGWHIRDVTADDAEAETGGEK